MANNMDYTSPQDGSSALDAFLAENPLFNDFQDFDADALLTGTGDSNTLNPNALSLDTTFANNSNNGFSLPQEVVSAATQTPQQQPQLPNMALGPCYHPMVGWYYPTTQPAGISPLPPPPPPPMMPVAGMSMSMTPATSVPTSAFASGTSALIPAVTNPAPTSAPKRKYGPSAYLDARAQGRTSIGADEANFFASSASRRDGRGEAAAADHASFDAAFRRTATRPSIVQACICGDGEGAERVKRPKNAFILFRLARADEIRKRLGTNNNQDVSRMASTWWKAASAETKARFAGLAEAEKRRHAEKYPAYKYKPGGQVRSKFGTQACTCGAYEKNLARFREKRNGKGRAGAYDDDAADASDAEVAYVPTRGARSQVPAPTAVMVPPPVPSPEELNAMTKEQIYIAMLGVPAHQQAQASATLAGMKRGHNLTVTTGREEEEPPRKRRSPRSSGQNVSYAESDDALFDMNAADLFDFAAPCGTPSPTVVEQYNPSPKSIRGSRKTSSASKGSKRSPSPLFVAPSPPARNTRSRGQSVPHPHEISSSPLTPEEDLPFGQQDEPIKIEDSDEEDNIVVSTRRSPRKSSVASKTSQASRRATRSQTTRRRSLRSGGK